MTTDRLAALLHEYGCGMHDDGGYCSGPEMHTEDAARLAAAGVTVAPQPGGLDVERAAFPWHRETIGHASVDQIAESVAASLHRNDNTDATWLVDSEDRIVAFIGNGPRQTDNGDLILAAIAREYGAAQPAAHPQCRERIDTKKAGPEGPASPEADAPRGLATVEAYAPAHVLVGLTCWCRPYPDREDPEVIIHRLEGKA